MNPPPTTRTTNVSPLASSLAATERQVIPGYMMGGGGRERARAGERERERRQTQTEAESERVEGKGEESEQTRGH
jgi:hypothetical protein